MAFLKNISFYPILNDQMFEYIFDNYNMLFSYKVNNETKQIEYIDEHDNISFDKNVDWNCDDYDLEISINIKLKNLNILFGPNGITPSNSTIGLCIEWYSPQSKIRKVIKSNKLISKNDNELYYSFNIVLPKQTFKGTVTLNALLYLSSSDKNISNTELYLNNDVGVLIGNIIKKIIFMSGNGSQLPIKICSYPDSDLLWDIELNLDEPGERQFSDGFAIIFNSAHKDYKMLDPTSPFYCERLAEEIITNAIVLFLSELSKSPEFDLEGDFEEGTLLSFAKYYRDHLDINFDGAKNISKSVHEYLEKGKLNGLQNIKS